MPSSISSSSPRRWWPTWLLCAAVAVACVAVVEWHWRRAGYEPGMLDSPQLWSIERDRVDATDKIPLVMLGASRIEFGIDMPLMRELLPKYTPIMLAQNAHYPLAVLRDLAEDEHFRGVVIVDIEPRGLYKTYTDLQQPLVDYYRRQWSPAWRVHRLLLTCWQQTAVVSNPDRDPVAIIKRKIAHQLPQPPDYVRFHADRSGDADYRKTDVEAARRHFSALIAARNGESQGRRRARPVAGRSRRRHRMDAPHRRARRTRRVLSVADQRRSARGRADHAPARACTGTVSRRWFPIRSTGCPIRS